MKAISKRHLSLKLIAKLLILSLIIIGISFNNNAYANASIKPKNLPNFLSTYDSNIDVVKNNEIEEPSNNSEEIDTMEVLNDSEDSDNKDKLDDTKENIDLEDKEDAYEREDKYERDDDDDRDDKKDRDHDDDRDDKKDRDHDDDDNDDDDEDDDDDDDDDEDDDDDDDDDDKKDKKDKKKKKDKEKPTIQLSYTVLNQTATITVDAKDEHSGIKSVKYLSGKITNIHDKAWKKNAIDITGQPNFTVTSAGDYSVLAEDKAGNRAITTIHVRLEFKAVWISYLEFQSHGKGGFTKESFETTMNTMFDNIVAMNMNAVVVQVRPYGDALYESSYFPWSKYVSGTQGVDPGFDPLEYMVQAAHARNLEIHAWLNPYRVTTSTTDFLTLSQDNMARIWYEDGDPTNDRNVLAFNNNLYYNPASQEVQNLIINGIKEIVQNYDVDGIHFDDYFYPSLGTNYAQIFDNVEYEAYVAQCIENNITPLNIVEWRRENVNNLVRNAYRSIKEIDSTVEFGISPGGFYKTLLSDNAYYTDIIKWLSSSEYVDYICPQIYWSFSHPTYPYGPALDQWIAYRTSPTVKVYVGIAVYKAGTDVEPEWLQPDILKRQIEYGRSTGCVDGFIFFRYDFMVNNATTQPAVDQLLEIL